MVIFEKLGPVKGSSILPIWGRRPAKPNKANVAKAFFINNMTDKSAKQTQRTHPNCYQLLTTILGAIFRKFGWKGRVSLSGIRADGQWRWQSGGFAEKSEFRVRGFLRTP